MTKEGDEILYHERLASPGRVFIFGGGHVSQALVPVLAGIDFPASSSTTGRNLLEPISFPRPWRCVRSIIKIAGRPWHHRR